MEKAEKYPEFHIIGSLKSQQRAAVFSFVLDGHHSDDIAEVLADHHIAVRSGKHCAFPLFETYGHAHSVRASLFLYNTTDEIDRFFAVMEKIIQK